MREFGEGEGNTEQHSKKVHWIQRVKTVDKQIKREIQSKRGRILGNKQQSKIINLKGN